MAMNYLWADMYGSGSSMNTAQTTIPEQSDKEAMPQAEHSTDNTAGIRDAGGHAADTKSIFLFMLLILVAAFLLGAM